MTQKKKNRKTAIQCGELATAFDIRTGSSVPWPHFQRPDPGVPQ